MRQLPLNATFPCTCGLSPPRFRCASPRNPRPRPRIPVNQRRARCQTCADHEYRAGHRHRLSRAARRAWRARHHAPAHPASAQHHRRRHPRRPVAPASRRRAVSPLQFAGRQSLLAGNQPARPRFHLRQPHPRHRRRCAAQRPHRRMDSLAGAAGARDQRRRTRARRRQRPLRIERHRRRRQHDHRRAHVRRRPSSESATAAKAPTTTACWPQPNAAPGACSPPAALIGTDGYIQEAPSQRGPVDIATNVHSQNGTASVPTTISGPLRSLCARQRLQRSAQQRHAIPDQRHPPLALCDRRRLAKRRAAPRSSPALRIDEHYRQTFSSISNLPNFGDPACSYRCGETPTNSPRSRQRAGRGRALEPAARRGPASRRRRRRARRARLGPRTDLRHVRRAHQSPRPPARLRRYAEAMWVHNAWTLPPPAAWTGFRTTTASSSHGMAQPGCRPPRSRRSATSASSIRASASRASSLTIGPSRPRASAPFARPRPTNSTAPRRSATSSPFPTATCSASAPQAGKPARHRVALGHHPLQLLPHPGQSPHRRGHHQCQLSPILLMRENLGQIESRGVALDFELAPRRWLAVDGGYQYAHATSRAARRISATGFPKSRATWPR